MFSKTFMLDVLDRAVRTAAQTAVALIGTGAVGVIDVDWQNVASVSVVAALVSVLTSVASSGAGDPDTPSLVRRGNHAA